jgi:ubiquinone/menaquinone biosynthesis C-methylase UbiE
MKKNNFDIKNLYLTNKYIINNPSLHEEDSLWKFTKITPFIDKFIIKHHKNEINLLDVGGGNGLILKMISTYIKKTYNIKVNKFALDLSPGILKFQKKINSDLKKALNENICKTSLGNKEIDLTLMIDVLEHVPNPEKALKEIKRISRFVIFKVPLEDNIFMKIWNFLGMGKPRKDIIKNIGHINIYNFNKLKYQIEKNTGKILDCYFTNIFKYYTESEYHKDKKKTIAKLIDFFAAQVFRLSPKLCSLIFNDFIIILVKCYD